MGVSCTKAYRVGMNGHGLKAMSNEKLTNGCKEQIVF